MTLQVLPKLLQVEAPVEIVLRGQDIEHMNDDILVNANIYEAQVNAESNRIAFQSKNGSSDVGSEDEKVTVAPSERIRSITFGSERELEYISDDHSVNPAVETIRQSKDYDGNRSMRSALKRK